MHCHDTLPVSQGPTRSVSHTVTRSISHVITVADTSLSHTHKVTHTQLPFPQVSHTASHTITWWAILIHSCPLSHTVSPWTHTTLPSSPYCTLSHMISCSHMLSRCHSPPDSVSGTPKRMMSHAVTDMSHTRSHTMSRCNMI